MSPRRVTKTIAPFKRFVTLVLLSSLIAFVILDPLAIIRKTRMNVVKLRIRIVPTGARNAA